MRGLNLGRARFAAKPPLWLRATAPPILGTDLIDPGPACRRMTSLQFFWNVLLAGAVVLIATRVGILLDREESLSTPVKWAILIAVVLGFAFLLSLLSRFGP